MERIENRIRKEEEIMKKVNDLRNKNEVIHEINEGKEEENKRINHIFQLVFFISLLP